MFATNDTCPPTRRSRIGALPRHKRIAAIRIEEPPARKTLAYSGGAEPHALRPLNFTELDVPLEALTW